MIQRQITRQPLPGLSDSIMLTMISVQNIFKTLNFNYKIHENHQMGATAPKSDPRHIDTLQQWNYTAIESDSLKYQKPKSWNTLPSITR